MIDRTEEFLSIVASLPQPPSILHRHDASPVTSLTEFHSAASSIAKDIHTVSHKLSQLTRLVQKRGMFDDPMEEINELVHIIKEDVQNINTQLDATQAYIDKQKYKLSNANGQYANHSRNIVGQLKSELMSATKKFKEILQVRGIKLKEQAERKNKLFSSKAVNLGKPIVYKPIQNSMNIGQSLDSGDKLKSLPRPWNTTDIDSAETSVSTPLIQPHQQQLQLIPEQSYLESRSTAMQEVEAHILELGTVFSRLASMIQEQRELVVNVHENVEFAESNVSRGQLALMDTLRSLQSNRMLMAKVSGIIIFFVLFFVIFMA